jgi:molybdenum storage protein
MRYGYFAIRPPKGRIPIHRTDVGLVILADHIGSRRVLFVKDEKGLCTEDPKRTRKPNSSPESVPGNCSIGTRTTW